MGDKKNAIKKLQITTRTLRLTPPLDLKEITLGSPKEYLRLFHHVFLDYNPLLAAEILNKHSMELSSKNDKLFIDGIYKLVRDMFGYVPKLTKDQFFQTSFAQIKALMASEIIEHILEKFRTTQPVLTRNKPGENSENIEHLSPREPITVKEQKETQPQPVVRKPSFKNNLAKNVRPKTNNVLKEQQLNAEDTQGQTDFEPILNTLMEKLNVLTSSFGNIIERINSIERKLEDFKPDKQENIDPKSYENMQNRITILESDLINVKQMLNRNLDRSIAYNDTTTYETPFHSFVNMSPKEDYPKKSSLIQGLAYDVEEIGSDIHDLTINSNDSTPKLSNGVKETRLSEEDRNILRAQELVSRANKLSQMLSNVI